ncbi:MAG: hypothetical protein KF861_09165 [Planctomycetaceae bacterium]|nr:hypothetical protein [Planctomycetaceae bacterium]
MQRSLVLGCLIALVVTGGEPDSASAQGMRGRLDWMFLTRDNDGATQPFINGPDAFNGSGINFDYESGYRVMLGFGTPTFEVEGQFTRVDEWRDSTFATLSQELVFDDSVNNPFIVGGTPGNTLGGNRAIVAAAMTPLTAMLDNETLEGEFLIPGAVATYAYQSDYYDLEVNLTTSRVNWFRVGLGYRHVRLNELSGFGVSGLFDALDVDDGQTVGGMSNDPNDGLSHSALTEAGLRHIAGGADGFNNLASGGGPDTVALALNSFANNRLNGFQGTFDANLADTEYFLVDLFARLGVFHNQSTAQVVEMVSGSGNDNSVYARTFQDSQNDFAMVTGAGVRLALKLNDFVRLHTGYEFIYIDGVALAPDQAFRVGPGNTFSIDNNGSVLIHGSRAGIEVVW